MVCYCEAAHLDSASLEQAKLKVREALQNVLLGDGAAAVSDETCLEQAKHKAQEALKNVLLGDDTAAARISLVTTDKRTPMMQFEAGQAQN